jgi:transposase-like protein
MYSLKQVPSEAQIRAFLRQSLFGKNLFCPVCRSRRVKRYEDRYRCLKCRGRFSVLSHTWLSNLKLPLQSWWRLLWCWRMQQPVFRAMALTGLPERTVRRWYTTFRLHLPADEHALERIVQLDKAFFRKASVILARQEDARKCAYPPSHKGVPDKTRVMRFLFEKGAPASELWGDAGPMSAKAGQGPATRTRDVQSRPDFVPVSAIERGRLILYLPAEAGSSPFERRFRGLVREFGFGFSSSRILNSPRSYLKIVVETVPTESAVQ